MKRNQFLTAIFMLAAVFTSAALCSSCSESSGDEEEEYADWKARNDAYFNKVYSDAQQAIKSGSKEWKIFNTWSVNETVATTTDHIVVKVLQEGTGSGCPIFTDNVYVHYIGRLMPSVSYPQGYSFDKSTQTLELNLASDEPSLFTVGQLTDGFSTALQYMHIGDYWRVYVPYTLAYKGASQAGIPAYSTLVFDIYLCKYFRDSESTIYWKAKENPWFEE